MRLARGDGAIRPRRGWRQFLPRTAAAGWRRGQAWSPLALLWLSRLAGASPTTLHRHFSMTTTQAAPLTIALRFATAADAVHADVARRAAVPSVTPTSRAAVPIVAVAMIYRTILRRAGHARESRTTAVFASRLVRVGAAIRAAAPAAALRWRITHDAGARPGTRGSIGFMERARARAAVPDAPSSRGSVRISPDPFVHCTRRAASAPHVQEPGLAASRVARTAPRAVRPPQLVWLQALDDHAGGEDAGRTSTTQRSLAQSDGAPQPVFTQPVAARQSPASPASIAADPVVVDRITREVIGRVEKHIRVERERRGV